MKQLRVTVTKDGATTIAVECGVTGEACADLTRHLEQSLGIVTKDEPTEAMWQTADVEVKA
jgi:hypothetical protein